MASPGESKVDENEVTSNHRGGDQEQEDGEAGGFPLVRQSSIYSLTLDEIQNTVCEPGKSFGSMNMDEFLNNIWSVEEGFAASNAAANANNNSSSSIPPANSAAPAPTVGNLPGSGAGTGGPPLHRQGSLTLPAPLSQKTVDEVWAEIHRAQEARRGLGDRAHRHGGSATRGGEGNGGAHRQTTFGEMTLEDFLIRAGVVREGYGPTSPHPPPGTPAPTTPAPVQPGFGLPVTYPGHAVGPGGPYEYHPAHPHGPHHHPAVSGEGHGKRYGNGYGMQQGVTNGSPVSPVSSDGVVGGGQVDNSRYGGGTEVNGMAKTSGRKRGADGAVEKVVERRQRRMIKNRESAARSRARKQAYTVELEAELNLLKEENARLREEEKRILALRKQMIADCMAEHARANAEKAAHSLCRSNSGPW